MINKTIETVGSQQNLIISKFWADKTLRLYL